MSAQLYQGDCIELMKNIPDSCVDMVLTDPPYGINYQSRWKKDKAKRNPQIIGDKVPSTEFIKYLKRVMKPSGCVMIFTRWDVQQKFIDTMNQDGLSVKNVLIWDKKAPGMGDLKRAYASSYESILFHSGREFSFRAKRPRDIISVQRVLPQNMIHPNEKPVKLLELLIEQCTREADIVLDPFMGSGSTGVACANMERNFIGMEINPKYFETARQRIEETHLQVTFRDLEAANQE